MEHFTSSYLIGQNAFHAPRKGCMRNTPGPFSSLKVVATQQDALGPDSDVPGCFFQTVNTVTLRWLGRLIGT